MALTQWTTRSTASNRVSSAAAPARGSGGRVIVPAIAPSHPGIDVVAALFPVPRFDLGRGGDAAQPLAGLVAVHRRHVEAHRPTVLPGDRIAVHGVGHDDIGTA